MNFYQEMETDQESRKRSPPPSWEPVLYIGDIGLDFKIN